MKNGQIEGSGRPTEEQLKEINKFTRREFTADEVYSFSVVLCDNDVDRDHERFTIEALKGMAELFVGKTGISDHSHRSSDQCARIYSCELVTDDTKKTVYGEPYVALKAKAYMPITEKTRELITEIDAGIKKEVSVGCSVGGRRCTVCGGDPAVCGHKKGRYYLKNGTKTLCAHELTKAVDAYEWSFVAVPAQPRAGVTKSFGASRDIDEIVKSLDCGSTELSGREAVELSKYISQMNEKCEAAEEYMALQKRRAIGNICSSLTDEQAAVIKAACDRMTPHELFALYRSAFTGDEAPVPQLKKAAKRDPGKKDNNKEFII